jgi:UDP-2,4-diacetamido-2,4,6-trideoxy-beta-L-altropyranose hydrolase
MTICFRCDANATIGFGHFYRCLSLANALFNEGLDCVFLLETDEEQIEKILKVSPHQHIMLSKHQRLDGSNQKENAQQWLIQMRKYNLTVSLIIIDHYQIETLWMNIIKQNAERLMVLNDSGRIWNNVDFIWDASCYYEQEYSSISSTTTLLLGPKYALLREEFQHKPQNKCKSNEIKKHPVLTTNLMLAIGATDPLNTTEKLLSWLISLPLNVHINVLSTSANKHIPPMIKKYDNSRINFIIDSQSIALAMAQQQVIITAAGNIMWEAFSLGIPCALIKTCSNQHRNIELVTKTMKNVYLGEETTLDSDGFLKKLSIITHATQCSMLSQQALRLCDGQGAIRTAKLLASAIGEDNDR